MMAPRSLLIPFVTLLAAVHSGYCAAVPDSVFRHAVRTVEIRPEVPILVPVHPRIATTISFPGPIGAPAGTGFVDAEAAQKAESEGRSLGGRGEYLIAYAEGESSFTVQPLEHGELLNLNVPFEGSTIVFYFHVVGDPLSAVASLSLVPRAEARMRRRNAAPPREESSAGARVGAPGHGALPATVLRPASPARLEGFLRKLRVLHAARAGAELDDLAAAMKVSVALSTAEAKPDAEITQATSPGAGFELILLRAVRDPAIDAVGFIVLFRSLAPEELSFDLGTLSARCGAALYTAQVVDAPASLKPGESKAGYFVIVGSGDGRPGYLAAGNEWRLSVTARSAGPAEQRTGGGHSPP